LKILRILANWLFILCLPILLLTASLAWAVNSLNLYESGLQKYGAAATTGLPESELNKIAAGLISYFNSNEAYIKVTAVKDGKTFEPFNQREIAHLRDVKGLIWLDYRVLSGTLLYTLGYALVNLLARRYRRLALAAVGGSGLTIALALVVGLAALLNEGAFADFFLQFHLLSFANDLWLLDPGDYLIMMFPQGFWYDAARACFIVTVIMAVILSVSAGWYIWFSRRKS